MSDIILKPGERWDPWSKKIVTSEVKVEPKPEKCYHDWVTQTMFRFDTTYCKKCGVERGKE